VATFRENRPRDVEESVDGKKEETLEMWANVMATLPNIGGLRPLLEYGAVTLPRRETR